MKKDILTILDLEKSDCDRLFRRAIALKSRHRQGIIETPLTGRSLGLIFDKHSTRTRLSFETAMIQLGGSSIFISSKDTQMARQEPVRDTARVLSRYLECLAIRTYSQELLTQFAEFATIPVINALTDLYHPCQVLSDLMTVIETKGGYEGVKIVWVGDGNNVAHSWINAAAVMGLTLVLACPEGYLPDAQIIERARARRNGTIELTSDPAEAVRNADVVYTDVWASMGQEGESSARKQVFAGYQVDAGLIEHARDDVVVMHCLPAHRGEEISDEVLEGSRSVVWDQAENKRHMHKAILETLITGR